MSDTLIICIIVAVCSLSLGAAVIIENCCPGLAFACGIILTLSVIGIYVEMHPRPTPMDVHQGRTTVEYRYIDGIKADSTIVFRPDLFLSE